VNDLIASLADSERFFDMQRNLSERMISRYTPILTMLQKRRVKENRKIAL
jgi:hypothetical protein